MPDQAEARPPKKWIALSADRLREVEDKWLGTDAPRTPDGKVERGHGSFYQRMTAEQKRHHAALEAAEAAEKKLEAASQAQAAARAAVDAARKTVAETWVP